MIAKRNFQLGISKLQIDDKALTLKRLHLVVNANETVIICESVKQMESLFINSAVPLQTKHAMEGLVLSVDTVTLET